MKQLVLDALCFMKTQLFATILVYCELVDVRKLWKKYSYELLNDYRNDEPDNVEYQIQHTLRNIKVFLESMDKQYYV